MVIVCLDNATVIFWIYLIFFTTTVYNRHSKSGAEIIIKNSPIYLKNPQLQVIYSKRKKLAAVIGIGHPWLPSARINRFCYMLFDIRFNSAVNAAYLSLGQSTLTETKSLMHQTLISVSIPFV